MTAPSSSVACFSDQERDILLQVKGVGPAIVGRLEELGITTLADLARQDAVDICTRVAGSLGSTCWKNSPMARKSLTSAIAAAQDHQNAQP
ncbi:helix-hairpin-helix domain-containing protein [Altererythrobacter xixiisoli]|uniref:Helix-hairpin-helix domain-containing protein n=1 Tax=Croceibacterium xixiisoli TaxID=1476466 RepID=A0A6I4TNF5_9SPHN|nr:helix-hairpin-helix domain-containing protein [Croceibacterium xixiisoli]MXO97504.1 helix-hairpin-helix domain-containing protein [Croceibacterium xixiisoli]